MEQKKHHITKSHLIWQLLMENLARGEARGKRMGLAAVGGREKPLLKAVWLEILADAGLCEGSCERDES